MEHGSKQWSDVTENENDFVVEADVVAGGGDAAVVGATVDGGFVVGGEVGEVGAVAEATVLLLAGTVVDDVVVEITVVVEELVVDVGATVTSVASGTDDVAGVVCVVKVVDAVGAPSSDSSALRDHAMALIPASDATARAASFRLVRTGRVAR